MRNRFVPSLIAPLALAACQGGEPSAAPMVEAARISLPAAPGLPGAGYFTVTGGAASDALVGVSSPAAARIEMHETVTDARGVSAMRPVAQVPLGSEISFAPGGRHLMVHDLRDGLAAGASIPLTFRFRTAPAVTVEAALLPPGGGHAGH